MSSPTHAVTWVGRERNYRTTHTITTPVMEILALRVKNPCFTLNENYNWKAV